MAGLEQLAGGEWFEIKERMHRPEQLFEHLCIESPGTRDAEQLRVTLEHHAERLESAIEGGVFEFRLHELSLIFGELAEAEYSSEVFGRLADLEFRLTGIVLITVVQRALLTRDIEFISSEDAEEPAEQAEQAAESADVNQIIADVKEIVQADPNAKMNAAIKNILLQLQKYRAETATYRKLKEQANSYRLEMYSRTFAATFNQIFDSIRKNYATFLEEQEEAKRRGRKSVVQDLDTRTWTRNLTHHIEQLSWARSTVMFARKEHAGVREPLVRLSRRRDDYLKDIAGEKDAAADAAGGEAAAHRLSRLIARDTALRLRRWSARITP
ncbi:MAG: hypothetical protein ACOCU4_07660 [Alkalispirochaeta sp.]